MIVSKETGGVFIETETPRYLQVGDPVVAGASVVSGDLEISLTSGSTINAGSVIGPTGPTGSVGPQGATGSAGSNATLSVSTAGTLLFSGTAVDIDLLGGLTATEAGGTVSLEVASTFVLPSSSMSNFLVNQNVSQSISASSFTKIGFDQTVFDDLSEFNKTESIFVPIESGTYIFYGACSGTSPTITNRALSVFLNGSELCRISQNTNSNANGVLAGASGPMKITAGSSISLNYFSAISDSIFIASSETYFSGVRVK